MISLEEYNFNSNFFTIPEVPDYAGFVEIKEPIQFQTGCDMKTLRRQLSIMNAEVDDCIKIQTCLYEQNSELWKCIQNLMSVNISNFSKMKNEMVFIDDSMRRIHEQRCNLEEKLQRAKTAQLMLQSMASEVAHVDATVLSVERARQEVETALQRSLAQTSELEERLHGAVTELQTLHNELEQWKLLQHDKESEEVAIRFYETSGHALRYGFRCFKRAIWRSRSVRRACSVLLHFYNLWIALRIWTAWKLFIRRARLQRRHWVASSISYRDEPSLTQPSIVVRYKRNYCTKSKSSIHTPAIELKCLSFARWKVYTALEKRFAFAYRKRLYRLCFYSWKETVREQSLVKYKECLADQWAAQRSRKLLKRACFVAWRAVTTFLEWDTPILRQQWIKATRKFVQKVMYFWLLEAKKSRRKLRDAAMGILRKRVHRKLLSWRMLYLSRSYIRQVVSRRVFYKLSLVKKRRLQEMSYNNKMVIAMKAIDKIHYQWTFWRWRLFLGSRMAYTAWEDNCSVMSYYRWKKRRCMNTLLRWRRITAIRRRLHACRELGLRHHRARLMHAGLTVWSRIKLKYKSKISIHDADNFHRRFSSSNFISYWLTYISLVYQKKENYAITRHHQSKKRSRKLRESFRSWRRWIIERRRRKLRCKTVEELRCKRVQSRCMSAWRLQLLRCLVGEVKKEEMEAERKSVEYAATLAAIQEAEKEMSTMAQTVQQLLALQSALRVAQAEKEQLGGELGKQQGRLEADKTVLLTSETEALAQLSSVRNELVRLREAEHEFVRAHRHAEELRKNRLLAIERENELHLQRLRPVVAEIEKEEQLLERDKEAAVVEDNKNTSSLNALQQEAQSIQKLVIEKQCQLEELESERESLQRDMQLMQIRLQATTAQGLDYVRSANSELRRKQGEFRVLRDSVALVDAQRRALVEQLHQRRSELIARDRIETDARESMESSQLQRLSLIVKAQLPKRSPMTPMRIEDSSSLANVFDQSTVLQSQSMSSPLWSSALTPDSGSGTRVGRTPTTPIGRSTASRRDSWRTRRSETMDLLRGDKDRASLWSLEARSSDTNQSASKPFERCNRSFSSTYNNKSA